MPRFAPHRVLRQAARPCARWTSTPTRAISSTAVRAAASPLDATEVFVDRHNGLAPSDVEAMLKVVGADSMDSLIKETIPSEIFMEGKLKLPPADVRRRPPPAAARARGALINSRECRITSSYFKLASNLRAQGPLSMKYERAHKSHCSLI